MKIEITEFRDIKFGEPSTKVRPLHTTPDGILWCDKKEEQKIGLVLVSQIMYGFYKGKFMTGRVKFGGLETYTILLAALTEKYQKPTHEIHGSVWRVGNVEITLLFNPGSQVNEGTLDYDFLPLTTELKADLDKMQTKELRMKVNAAKFDL